MLISMEECVQLDRQERKSRWAAQLLRVAILLTAVCGVYVGGLTFGGDWHDFGNRDVVGFALIYGSLGAFPFVLLLDRWTRKRQS